MLTYHFLHRIDALSYTDLNQDKFWESDKMRHNSKTLRTSIASHSGAEDDMRLTRMLRLRAADCNTHCSLTSSNTCLRKRITLKEAWLYVTAATKLFKVAPGLSAT